MTLWRNACGARVLLTTWRGPLAKWTVVLRWSQFGTSQAPVHWHWQLMVAQHDVGTATAPRCKSCHLQVMRQYSKTYSRFPGSGNSHVHHATPRLWFIWYRCGQRWRSEGPGPSGPTRSAPEPAQTAKHFTHGLRNGRTAVNMALHCHAASPKRPPARCSNHSSLLKPGA